MLIALLLALGVDLIVVVAFAAAVIGRRQWLKRQPDEFAGAIRVSSGEVDRDLPDMDGLGQLPDLPGAAAELAQGVPGFSWALARSPGIVVRLAAFCEAALFRPR